MKVFITGATGFVGRMVVARMLGDGCEVVAWCRDETRGRATLGADPRIASPANDTLDEALAGCDAVINLQGENIFSGRWSASRKARLEDSRIQFTDTLVEAIRALGSNAPRTFVSASAVGYYGADVREEIAEDAPAGSDYLAHLCERWESAAFPLRADGVRVVTLRIGVVLGRGGGALEKMLPPFRLGLGGKLGSGQQHFSWIHINDSVSLIAQSVCDSRYEGAFNATAPAPVTNAELTRAISGALRRPAVFGVPGVALRVMLGEAAGVLLGGQRALPRRAQTLGFRFEFEELSHAIDDLLTGGGVRIRDMKSDEARHLLEQETMVDAPIETVFAFFSKAENLGAMTPPNLSFGIDGTPPQNLQEGTHLDYDIKLGPLPLRWRSLIDHWDAGRGFADRQLKGPYAYWRHEHSFEPRGNRTLMRDTVRYRLPFGAFGRLVHRLFVRWQLSNIFAYRGQYTAQRFRKRARAVGSVQAA